MTFIDPVLAAAIADKGIPLSADMAPLSPARERMIRIWHHELARLTDQTAVARREALGDLLGEIDRVRVALSVAETRIRELERPAVEAKRNEVRESYMELANQAREGRDYEGAFDVDCRLREREAQWKNEDEEAVR